MEPRSYRTTELAKELARQGHEVILYAVLGSFNYSRFEKEHNLKVRNIGKMWFATSNSDDKGRRNFLDKILGRLFHRLFEFPDIELMFRMPGIIRREKEIDLLISIAWPFPIHWGCALAKTISTINFPKVWVADCGDPYMGNKVARYRKLFYFSYIEKWFSKRANFITIPNEGAYKGYYKEFWNKIKVIPQGFRFEDIKIDTNSQKNKVPTFAYSGIFYKGIRDPTLFLEYLTTLNTKFLFVIYTTHKKIISPFLDRLSGKIEIRDYVPREQLLYELSQMDFLVNFENGTSVQSPSKLIDYALVKKPILSVDSNKIQTNVVSEFLNGNYKNQYIVQDINQYNISNIAKKFLALY